MARDRLPPSANPSEESDPEEEESEEEEEEEEEQVDADAGDRKEAEADSDEEDEVEEESSEKTASPTRGLDYGSDVDSGKTLTSPSGSDFIVKKNSEDEVKTKKKNKKRSAEMSYLLKEKSEVKKSKKGNKENSVVVAEDDVVAEDKAKRSTGGLRIWGPEDELMILTGMLDYKEKTGVDFNSNLDAFYQFIKGSLNAIVDKGQVINKIRKLREKYRDNVLKEANGEAPVFLKVHEEEVYEHSKKIWGGNPVARIKSKSKKEKNVASNAPVVEVDNVLALPVPELEMSKKEVNGGSAKSASRAPKAVQKPKVVQKMDLIESDVEMKDSIIPMPYMIDDSVFEKGLELVEKSKLDALNEKWTKYQIDAAELYVKRLDLMMERTKLIIDALKSNLR